MRLEDGCSTTSCLAVEARHTAELEAKDYLLAEYRKQLEFQRQQIEALQDIIKSLAQNGTAKYDLRGAHFSGGFAESVHGNQISRIQSNRSQHNS